MLIAPHSHTLAEVPLFADLDRGILDALAAESWIRRYPKGQVLVSEGDRCEEFKFLEEGRVRVSRFTQGGRETVLFVREPPAVFGELALFDGALCSVTLIADSDVRVRMFDRRYMLTVIEQNPGAAMALLRFMAATTRATNERLVDMMSLDAPGRLAKWLLTQAADDGWLTLDQSQEALALSLGTTRVTVNQILRRFERLGLVDVRGKTIELCDVPALQSIASG